MRSEAPELVWWPESGMGWYPVADTEAPYDQAYFERYRAMAETEIGRRLNGLRVRLFRRWNTGPVDVVDVGIGSGAFLQLLGRGAWGWDVNPAAVDWLERRGLLRNPYEGCSTVTCWDSLEHLADPAALVAAVRERLFVSLPIFTGPDHVLRSRHFRRDEHVWYWTRDGFIAWLARHGFRTVEHSTMESLAGREDIHSFVAERVA
jgi:hypothetical protein